MSILKINRRPHDRVFKSTVELEIEKYAVGVTMLVNSRLNCPLGDLGGEVND